MNRIYAGIACWLICAAALNPVGAHACKISSAASHGRVFAAANKDVNSPNAKIWFTPAAGTAGDFIRML